MPNFNLTQNWVGYLQRSYEQIKQSIITKLIANNPEITDHTESNILILIVDIFAGIAEMLNLYIDRMAQEAFIGTAQRFSSVIKLAELVDYRPKASIPASVDLTFTTTTGGGPIYNNLVQVVIPAGTQIKSTGGLYFVTTEDGIIPIGQSQVQIPALQYIAITGEIIGIADGTASQVVPLPDGYTQGSLVIINGPDTINLIETLGLAMGTDLVCVVKMGYDGLLYVQFGDGVQGAIPSSPTFPFYATYWKTEGVKGNIPPNTITFPVSVLPTLPSGKVWKVTNLNYASNGVDPETIEEVRLSAPRSIRTIYRAVTAQDYEDLALLIPGVGLAKARYCCGECVKIYLGPKSKGIASGYLLTSAYLYLCTKVMLGRCVKVFPAGITRVWLKLSIQPKYGITSEVAQSSFATTMDDKLGYLSSKINKQIHKSDIIAAIDNDPNIDYVDLIEMWAEPFARPSNTPTYLNWVPVILIGSVLRKPWKLIYDGTLSQFNIYLNNVLIGVIPTGIPFGDIYGIMTFTINPGPYLSGDTWEFITYPYNQNIDIDDNTIPLVDVSFVAYPYTGFYDLSIINSNTTESCNALC